MAFVKQEQNRHKFSPKKEKTCAVCNKTFLPYASRQTTCSPECSRIQENRKQRANHKRKYVKKDITSLEKIITTIKRKVKIVEKIGFIQSTVRTIVKSVVRNL